MTKLSLREKITNNATLLLVLCLQNNSPIPTTTNTDIVSTTASTASSSQSPHVIFTIISGAILFTTICFTVKGIWHFMSPPSPVIPKDPIFSYKHQVLEIKKTFYQWHTQLEGQYFLPENVFASPDCPYNWDSIINLRQYLDFVACFQPLS